jgi:hypothetical protein
MAYALRLPSAGPSRQYRRKEAYPSRPDLQDTDTPTLPAIGAS